MTEPLGKFRFEIDLSTCFVRVQIPGEPQAWERPGRSGARTFDTKANIAAKQEIRRHLRLARPQLGNGDKYDAANRFGVIFLFATNKWNTDKDNYEKLVLDAVKKFVWKDDSQCDEGYVRVVRGVNLQPRSELTFYTIEGSKIE